MDVVHGSALVSHSAGISACEKGEQWQRALALLSEMREAKLEPDVIYTTIPGIARARGGITYFLSAAPPAAPPRRRSWGDDVLSQESPQRAHRRVQRGPKSAQDGPTTAQEGFQAAQEEPKTPS